MEKIGLIAGNRKFPLLFCEAARKKGFSVIAIAIKGDTSIRINRLADKVHWLNLEEFERIFGIFGSQGVKKIVMAGQISPWRLFSRQVKESRDIQQILSSIKNKKADSIFGAIAGKLEEGGLSLLDSSTFMEDLLVRKGALTACEPSQEVLGDIHFGFELAKSVAALDIGQAVAVKEKAVVAVEALEGTDNLIRRSGKISRGGITIVKVAKPKQDMRFDIPVIGLRTIQSLVAARARCLAVEADKTLFIDRDSSVKLAEKKAIAIVGV
ncbi:MAG: UDP-2,3-diacylglucosamine diphosphatase LpxI [Candidatus Omnitrophota bacterium]